MYYYNKTIGFYIGDKADETDIGLTEEQFNQYNGKDVVYEDGEFVEVETPIIIPTSITMRQCRLELLAQGVLDQVNALIEGNAEAQIEWEYATTIERSNMLVTTMQNALNLTDEQVDEMFLSASKR